MGSVLPLTISAVAVVCHVILQGPSGRLWCSWRLRYRSLTPAALPRHVGQSQVVSCCEVSRVWQMRVTHIAELSWPA